LFGTESSPVYEINPPVSPELETTPETTTYHFVLPPEMAHIANTTSVQTGITATTLPPINTQRTPEANPNLPPGYCALNPLVNVSHPTPPQTPAGSPSGPHFPGHPIPGFIPTLPQFPIGNPNLVALSRPLHLMYRFLLVDRVAQFRFLFPFPDITQLLHNLRLVYNSRVELSL
jgi:hypothetical protein